MTSTSRIPILDRPAIERKLQRMAYQIWERNSGALSVTLIGIEKGGAVLAAELAERLRAVSPLEVRLERLRMDKRQPLSAAPQLSGPIDGEALVLVDDVASSGKTLLYALQPLLAAAPAQITVAVLVERQHKAFPVSPDIVGHRLATTLQEHIVVEIEGDRAVSAYIE